MTATLDQTAQVERDRPAHRFTFGLWTVGNPGRDPFGGPTREPVDPVDSVHKLAELGAWGVSLHDDDLIPWGVSAAERRQIVDRFKDALESTGMGVGMATTNLFGHPAFKDGAFTSNDRKVRRAAIGKAMNFIDIAAELGAEVYVFWGGREGTEAGVAKDPRDALERYREAINVLSDYVVAQRLRPALRDGAQAQRAARGHLPADRRPRAALHRDARPPRDGRRQPRGRARDDGRPVVPPRRRPGAVGGQALPHRPQRPADRPLRPGLPLRRGGPEGELPARPAARARGLRGPAALRRALLPQRERRRRLGLRARLHVDLPPARRAGASTSTRCPRSRRPSRPPRPPSWRSPRSTATRPTRSRPRPGSWTPWPNAATSTRSWTSFSSTFSSACAETLDSDRRSVFSWRAGRICLRVFLGGEREVHRMLATAAAVGAALVVVPSASAQGPDTTAPVLNVGTLTPTAAPQRNGNPPAAPSTSTGNNGWFTQAAPTVLNVTATDDVAVTKLQYSTDAGATWLDMTITPGPSVSGTASLTAEGNNAIRYRALDAAGNIAARRRRRDDAQPGRGRRRDRGPPREHERPRRRRRAGHRHRRQPGDGEDRHDHHARIRRRRTPNVTLAAAADEGACRQRRDPDLPAVPLDQRPDRHAPGDRRLADRRGRQQPIGHGLAPITPTRTDPTPGSGSARRA